MRNIFATPSIRPTILPTETQTECLDFSPALTSSMAEALYRWEARATLGEQRDIAIAKVRDCWERRLDTLKLDNLGLKSLPPCLPQIRMLSCAGNRLTAIDNLPDSIEKLRLANNSRLEQLLSLPSSLRKLDASACDLIEIPELADMEHLRKLILAGNDRLTYVPELPDSLEKLDVSDCGLKDCPEWSINTFLRDINLSGNSALKLLPTLPQDLEKLQADHCGLVLLPAWPERLQYLSVAHNPLKFPPYPFPASLRKADLSHCQLDVLPQHLLTSKCPVIEPNRNNFVVKINKLWQKFLQQFIEPPSQSGASSKVRPATFVLPDDERDAISVQIADPSRKKVAITIPQQVLDNLMELDDHGGRMAYPHRVIIELPKPVAAAVLSAKGAIELSGRSLAFLKAQRLRVIDTEIDLSGNELRELPSSFRHLPSNISLDLFNNSFSEEAKYAWGKKQMRDDYHGPAVSFYRPLHQRDEMAPLPPMRQSFNANLIKI